MKLQCFTFLLSLTLPASITAEIPSPACHNPMPRIPPVGKSPFDTNTRAFLELLSNTPQFTHMHSSLRESTKMLYTVLTAIDQKTRYIPYFPFSQAMKLYLQLIEQKLHCWPLPKYLAFYLVQLRDVTFKGQIESSEPKKTVPPVAAPVRDVGGGTDVPWISGKVAPDTWGSKSTAPVNPSNANMDSGPHPGEQYSYKLFGTEAKAGASNIEGNVDYFSGQSAFATPQKINLQKSAPSKQNFGFQTPLRNERGGRGGGDGGSGGSQISILGPALNGQERALKFGTGGSNLFGSQFPVLGPRLNTREQAFGVGSNDRVEPGSNVREQAFRDDNNNQIGNRFSVLGPSLDARERAFGPGSDDQFGTFAGIPKFQIPRKPNPVFQPPQNPIAISTPALNNIENPIVIEDDSNDGNSRDQMEIEPAPGGREGAGGRLQKRAFEETATSRPEDKRLAIIFPEPLKLLQTDIEYFWSTIFDLINSQQYLGITQDQVKPAWQVALPWREYGDTLDKVLDILRVWQKDKEVRQKLVSAQRLEAKFGYLLQAMTLGRLVAAEPRKVEEETDQVVDKVDVQEDLW
ncbi:hypothetical protein TWF281_000342 [Arthrobotrys megalospora]